MVRLAVTLALVFITGSIALPNPNAAPQDPSGDKNIGNGQGLQFITGACLSDADCQSGCCATLNGGGVCSAEAASNEQGKQGCGFNGGEATPAASSVVTSAQPAQTAGGAGGENVGTGSGQQFITGQCTSDADCASGCCAGSEGSSEGTCSARAVAEDSGKTGCGFTQAA